MSENLLEVLGKTCLQLIQRRRKKKKKKRDKHEMKEYAG